VNNQEIDMFLALREIKHSWLRFLLVGAIMTLLAWLVFLLSGLATGLATDNASSFQNMKADYIAFEPETRQSLSRSLLEKTAAERIRQVPGVTAAAPLGESIITVQTTASAKIDVAVFGIEAESFLAPKIEKGGGLKGMPAGSVVVDKTFLESGQLEIGSSLTDPTSGVKLTVVGFTSGQTYSHVPVIFTDIATWQSLRFVNAASKDNLADPVSAIAIQMNKDQLAPVKALGGLDVVTRQEAIQKLPGYSEEMGTISMIMVFLFLIASFIMAAFFYVMTLQKTNQFGILKTLGANTGFLAKDLVGQVILLAVAGVVAGALLTFGVAAIMPVSVPFSLDSTIVLGYGLLLVGVALAGTLLSLWRIARIDPLLAIGRAD
jgi:putative ABC transport system permease protein